MSTEKTHDFDIEKTLGTGEKSPHKRSKKWILLILLATVLLGGLMLWSKGSKPSALQFKTEKIEKGDLTILVTATGTLEPTNEVEVGSEQSGIIDSIEVDYNDKVTVGQILARIDTTKLQAQVTQSEAALEAAKASVLQAEATVTETQNKLEQYKKVRKLSDNKVPSQTVFDEAQAEYARAQADYASALASVSQAEATLDGDQTDLSKAIIHSPINGIVLTREVETGQTVAASLETPVLFTLAEDLTKMELHVDVDEADIGQVREGQQATFTVDAYPDRTFDAVITQTRYGAETVDGVVTYETVLKVDNSELLLRPGMTATADIIVMQIKDTLLVSNSALRFEMPEDTGNSGGGIMNSILPHPPRRESTQKESTISRNSEHQVWTLTADGRPEPVTVKVGETDGVMTQITDGAVEAGTSLIVDTINGAK